jgi:hypothetical protein
MMIMIITNTFTGWGAQDAVVACSEDRLFQMTSTANEFFSGNYESKIALLIISSLFIDVLFVNLVIKFILFAKTWRVMITILIFYFCRCVCQTLFILEKPKGYIWEYPGFPSLTVSYKPTVDFFFSGHIGFAVITALDNFDSRWYFMGATAIFSAFLEFFTMVFLRAHYTIDLVAGVVFAHYSWIIAGKICKIVETRFKITKKDL